MLLGAYLTSCQCLPAFISSSEQIVEFLVYDYFTVIKKHFHVFLYLKWQQSSFFTQNFILLLSVELFWTCFNFFDSRYLSSITVNKQYDILKLILRLALQRIEFKISNLSWKETLNYLYKSRKYFNLGLWPSSDMICHGLWAYILWENNKFSFFFINYIHCYDYTTQNFDFNAFLIEFF